METQTLTLDPTTRPLVKMFIALAYLNALDLYATWLVLGAGGAESNPIMGWAMQSWWTAIGLKIAGLTVVGVALSRAKNKKRAGQFLYVTCWVYAIIVIWNLLVYSSLT